VNGKRTIAVVTGSRADYGLLKPVIRALEEREDASVQVRRTGAHYLGTSSTGVEVEADFPSSTEVVMPRPDSAGRIADAVALIAGMTAFVHQFQEDPPDVVLVLGDRIEAFAAAAAASVAGIRAAHMHGGDRAEGIADEAMRHAITKLAHIHLPATEESAQRIIRMGEDPDRVHIVGSPAIDGLRDIAPLEEHEYEALGRPEIVFLLHPIGRDDESECDDARRLLDACRSAGRVLALHPNHDPGRNGILRAIEETTDLLHLPHLPREQFIGLLRRAKVIVGNSSAGLIECAALPLWCINIGPRQRGREKPANVIDCGESEPGQVEAALRGAFREPAPPYDGRYGRGEAGRRTADLLATFDSDKHPIRKRNTY
jgi:UDP-hydrolysing UDP-N-acetyl-D-glucosamine 2-epimerase